MVSIACSRSASRNAQRIARNQELLATTDASIWDAVIEARRDLNRPLAERGILKREPLPEMDLFQHRLHPAGQQRNRAGSLSRNKQT